MIRKFLKRAFCFLTPLALIYFICVFAADPFNYFQFFHFLDNDFKEMNIPRGDRVLWSLVAYGNDPCPNIILGDSRANNISVKKLKEITGKDYFNLGVAGGNALSIKSAFWFAVSKTRLKHVCIGVALQTLGECDPSLNPIGRSTELLKNGSFFYKNAAVKIGANLLMKKYFSLSFMENPTLPYNENNQWRYFMVLCSQQFKHYEYSCVFLQELKKISDYCRANEVKLTFIIFPTHEELHQCVKGCHLENMENRLKEDVKKLGELYDFDYINEVTIHRESFKDPVHASSKVYEDIIREVWLGKTHSARYFPAR